MRFVDRKTFLTLPAGTLYCRLPSDPRTVDFGELLIKGETCTSGNDWFTQELVGWFADCNDTGDLIEAWDQMLAGADRTIDFEMPARDGRFDEHQRYAVFSRDDHVALIQRLVRALGDTLP